MIHIHSPDQLYIFNTIENGWLNRWRDIYMLPSFQSCLSWKLRLSQQQWTPSLNHTLGTELNRHLKCSSQRTFMFCHISPGKTNQWSEIKQTKFGPENVIGLREESDGFSALPLLVALICLERWGRWGQAGHISWTSNANGEHLTQKENNKKYLMQLMMMILCWFLVYLTIYLRK